jgi:NAD(P)-dependent dehydrogenase (short-subunit alcohol dehydrogenase family)
MVSGGGIGRSIALAMAQVGADVAVGVTLSKRARRNGR